jgi:cytochrome c-type biogenesis protein CcmH
LAATPDDAAGWDVIAPVYLRLGRFADAERAYRNAIRLAGPSGSRHTGLGEAILASQGGVVTAEARAAFQAANEADPRAPAPRFFLALAAEQEGNSEAAAQGWQALLAETPETAPWRQAVIDGLARVGAPPAPGPDAGQVAAAQAMAPGDRTAMIEGMVSGLAERLKTQPDDVEGWLRLIRSYSVLGRPDDAVNAVRAALRGVRATGERERVAALVSDLGLPQEALSP